MPSNSEPTDFDNTLTIKQLFMKPIYTLIVFLFFSIATYSSIVKKYYHVTGENATCDFSKKVCSIDSSWQKDTIIREVSFYHKITTCAGEEVVLLTIENNNNSPVSLSWSDEVWIDGAISALSSNKTFVLNVAESKEGSCGDSHLKLFEIRRSDISNEGNHITEFHFRNIHVIL